MQLQYPPPAVGRAAVRRQLRLRLGLSSRSTSRSACRASRSRVDRRRRRRHARVQGDGRLRAAVRPGPAVRQRTSTQCVDGFIGGWQISGTTRIQSGRLFDLGNVRVVGMTIEEVQDLFKLRKESDTIVYAWPQDIIDETIKAYSVSATSADRLRRARGAERDVLRAGERAGLHRDDQQQLRRLRRAHAHRHGPAGR